MSATTQTKKNYITPAGLERLCAERDYLLKEERPRVTKIVSWAASLGDRSENADYQYGKKRLREIDRRLRFLGTRIESALVVDPRKKEAQVIQFGACVKLENSEGVERTFTIVGVDEIDTKLGLISWLSPIAKSLLGRMVGDDIVVRAPGGEEEYEVVSIDYHEIKISPFSAETLDEVFNK